MINKKFFSGPDDKLENALLLLATGIPLPEVLAEAGDDAVWLGPLLEMAAEIGELRQGVPLPPPGRSLQRMLDYGQEAGVGRSTIVFRPGGLQAGLVRLLGGLIPHLAGVLAALLLVVVLLGSAVTLLARQSLPGQPLYPLKRAGETVQLAITFNSQERDRLQENFNQRRQQEVKLLLEQDRVASVAFEGQVEAVTATSLTVAGLTAQLTPQTEIKGNLAIGARIRLEVQTQPRDQLIVLSVVILEPGPPTPTPTITLTPTLWATASPGMSQATDTLILSTSTPTPVLSRDTDVLIMPSSTPTPTPTPIPPSPPASPTPDGAELEPTAAPRLDDDNSNDNANDDRGGDDNKDDVDDNANDNENDDTIDNSGSGDKDDNSGSSGKDDTSGSSDRDDNSGSSGRGGKDDRDDD